ncbi:MAG: PP2C family serine/threonine-protein phosphatase [bacterium]
MKFDIVRDPQFPELLLSKIGLVDMSAADTGDEFLNNKNFLWEAYQNLPNNRACSKSVADALSEFVESLDPDKNINETHFVNLKDLLKTWRENQGHMLKREFQKPDSEMMRDMVLVKLNCKALPSEDIKDLHKGFIEVFRKWLDSDPTGKSLDELRKWVQYGIDKWSKESKSLEKAKVTQFKEPDLIEMNENSTGNGDSYQPEVNERHIPGKSEEIQLSNGVVADKEKKVAISSDESVERIDILEGLTKALEKTVPLIGKGEPIEVKAEKVLNPPGAPPEVSLEAPSAPWKYLPLPSDPEQHTEYDVRSVKSPDGRIILGARVRGKKHKHDGTNCDDWFEHGVSGSWSILAVSDGGGSYIYSRLGAKAACIGAVRFLSDALKNCVFTPKKQITEELTKDEAFLYARNALHESIKAAWDEVYTTYENRYDRFSYIQVLPIHRQLTLKDFYSTLLVAIQTSVETKEGIRSLVMGWAAGDGMISVVSKEGDISLLMKPDSGDYSAQVEFFTQKTLEKRSMDARTYTYIGGMNALMLMTDGVSDDYYPHDTRMGELYADLILNGILPIEDASEERIISDFKIVKVPDQVTFTKLDYFVETERLLEKPETIRLASAKKLADILGIAPHSLVRHPGLLQAALRNPVQPMPGVINREDRLLTWLDTYYVRGSFDDRTLVLMGARGVK